MWAQNKNKNRGFTIVELLIVVVVIAILAAITIVAYNGIKSRALDSTEKQDAAQASKVLEMDFITNGSYPTVISMANGGKGLKPSSDNKFYYLLDTGVSPATYALVACNPSSSSYYKVSSSNTTPTTIPPPNPQVYNSTSPLAGKYVEGSSFNGIIGPGGRVYAFYADSGTKITMSTSYNCTPTPRIQWQRQPASGSFADIPGATGSTYTTPVLSSANNQDAYRAVITNSVGADSNTPTTLYVDYDP